jgi:hypothetical protein
MEQGDISCGPRRPDHAGKGKQMGHLRLVVPGQKTARGAALGQVRDDLSRRELGRVFTMIEGREEFTAAKESNGQTERKQPGGERKKAANH